MRARHPDPDFIFAEVHRKEERIAADRLRTMPNHAGLGDVALRADPVPRGDVVADLAAGDILEVTGPPRREQKRTWYPVQDPANADRTGYVLKEDLVDAAAP